MQLLTARIIHKCLKKLLAAGTPLALEKLLKLLQIARPSLREEDQGLTEYTSPLKEMVEKYKAPSRLLLLMQNFLELPRARLEADSSWVLQEGSEVHQQRGGDADMHPVENVFVYLK